MIIRRSRKFTVNMGNYESYTFGAEVELSHLDLGVSDSELLVMALNARDDLNASIKESVMSHLDEQLAAEVNEAVGLTRDQKSFLHRAIKGAAA